MSTLRQAVQAAHLFLVDLQQNNWRTPIKQVMEQLATALAEPQPEPVAWRYTHKVHGDVGVLINRAKVSSELYKEEPLYAAPLAEPQPLTDEQWYQLWLAIHRDFAGDPYDELKAFARAIEAAHGIGVKS